MKRFLLVLALVAAAGATYVATAPGSQTAGPTAKQFKALEKQFKAVQKQVKALQKQVTAARSDTDNLGGFLLECMAHAPVGVDSVGDNVTMGYLFGAPGTPPASATSTSALTLDGATPTYRFFTANQTVPACADIINQASKRHALKHLLVFPRP